METRRKKIFFFFLKKISAAAPPSQLTVSDRLTVAKTVAGSSRLSASAPSGRLVNRAENNTVRLCRYVRCISMGFSLEFNFELIGNVVTFHLVVCFVRLVTSAAEIFYEFGCGATPSRERLANRMFKSKIRRKTRNEKQGS